jgi:aminoglycoside phosphotransferase (APT) family kinase protein
VPAWDAEVVVDETRVRRLLGQFPELRIGSLRRLAEGWDNDVWLVDETWAFRFPRRAIGIPGIERELRVLPRLAPLVSVAIPTPVFAGQADGEYPWPFFGAPVVPGVESCDASLDEDARAALAVPLASILRDLHNTRLDVELPVDPNARADMARRVPRTRAPLEEVERLGLWRTPRAATQLLDRAERLPASTEATLTHGDLHFRHVLVDDGRLSGVIDWGDVCRADPAIDLQLVWSFVPPQARPAFLDAYGPVTDDQLLRARVVALSLAAFLAAYGHERGLEAVEADAIAALERTATG